MPYRAAETLYWPIILLSLKLLQNSPVNTPNIQTKTMFRMGRRLGRLGCLFDWPRHALVLPGMCIDLKLQTWFPDPASSLSPEHQTTFAAGQLRGRPRRHPRRAWTCCNGVRERHLPVSLCRPRSLCGRPLPQRHRPSCAGSGSAGRGSDDPRRFHTRSQREQPLTGRLGPSRHWTVPRRQPGSRLLGRDRRSRQSGRQQQRWRCRRMAAMHAVRCRDLCSRQRYGMHDMRGRGVVIPWGSVVPGLPRAGNSVAGLAHNAAWKRCAVHGVWPLLHCCVCCHRCHSHHDSSSKSNDGSAHHKQGSANNPNSHTAVQHKRGCAYYNVLSGGGGSGGNHDDSGRAGAGERVRQWDPGTLPHILLVRMVPKSPR